MTEHDESDEEEEYHPQALSRPGSPRTEVHQIVGVLNRDEINTGALPEYDLNQLDFDEAPTDAALRPEDNPNSGGALGGTAVGTEGFAAQSVGHGTALVDALNRLDGLDPLEVGVAIDGLNQQRKNTGAVPDAELNQQQASNPNSVANAILNPQRNITGAVPTDSLNQQREHNIGNSYALALGQIQSLSDVVTNLQSQLNDALCALDNQRIERASDRISIEEAMNAKLDELADLHDLHLEQQQDAFETKLKEFASDKTSDGNQKREMRDATCSPPRPIKRSEIATSPIVPSGTPPASFF